MGSNEKSESKDVEQGVMNQTKVEKNASQVGHLGLSVTSESCSGSDLSVGRIFNSLVLIKARLREEDLKNEYELLRARNEVQLAEIALESDYESADDMLICMLVELWKL